MKTQEYSVRRLKKITNDFNKQGCFVKLHAFEKIRDYIRYAGFHGFNLKKENAKNFKFDELLFLKIYCLENKICALNYHTLNIKKFQSEHKRNLAEFASLFGNIQIIHSARILQYEFEVSHFQFKACLDLLANIIFHLYGKQVKYSPLRKFKQNFATEYKDKYLADKVCKIMNEKWLEKFLSDENIEERKTKRDKIAHYPWALKYTPSETKYINNKFEYTPLKEDGGEELYKYCRNYLRKIQKMTNSCLDLFFQLESY